VREIKFRAWDKEDKKMLNDYATYLMLCREGGFDESKRNYDLMQYTGLKDKDGKEIYEGDVVRTNEAGWIAKVKWFEGKFVCVDNKGGFSGDLTSCLLEGEVIGNIYENPELNAI